MASVRLHKPFDLTRDRPLKYSEAQALSNWWNQQPNVIVQLTRAQSLETYKRYHVTGTISSLESQK